jgi:hypothetical protein
MKKILLPFLIIFSGLLQAQNKNSGITDIETKIQFAAINSYTKGPEELIEIADSLDRLREKNNQHYLSYWHAFALYKLGAYYLNKDKPASEKTVQKAIDVLEEIKNKTSDEHVLLGSLISLSINFYPGNAAVLSPKSKDHFLKAIQLDKNNMRAFYGLARSDYYRPKEYGGGLLVEENLLKALSLKAKNSQDPLAPTWGREDVYMLLINYYLREDRKEDAALFYRKALKEFPGNSQLILLDKKLKS